jgi:hypothetical protein
MRAGTFLVGAGGKPRLCEDTRGATTRTFAEVEGKTNLVAARAGTDTLAAVTAQVTSAAAARTGRSDLAFLVVEELRCRAIGSNVSTVDGHTLARTTTALIGRDREGSGSGGTTLGHGRKRGVIQRGRGQVRCPAATVDDRSRTGMDAALSARRRGGSGIGARTREKRRAKDVVDGALLGEDGAAWSRGTRSAETGVRQQAERANIGSNVVSCCPAGTKSEARDALGNIVTIAAVSRTCAVTKSSSTAATRSECEG